MRSTIKPCAQYDAGASVVSRASKMPDLTGSTRVFLTLVTLRKLQRHIDICKCLNVGPLCFGVCLGVAE